MKKGKRRFSFIFLVAMAFPVFLVGGLALKHPVLFERENVWAVGVYEGKSPLEVMESRSINNPLITASDVTDIKASFVADPFLFRKDSVWYMFFEVLNSLDGKGDIGMAVSADGRNWKYSQIVLDEEFHLSYPYVFEHNGQIYMIPESASAKHLRLYRAVDFPYRWEFAWKLLDGEFGDHAIFRYDEMWWLFAGSDPYKNTTLRLYYAEDLRDIWKEHPESPVVKDDADIARPAGRVIMDGGKIYRLAQDCDPSYGRSVNAFEITELSKTRFAESPWESNPVLDRGRSGWTAHGMHHLDAHRAENGKWIASIDGYVRRFIIKINY
ncbi:MAG: glycoside hydrolase family 32 protein [Fibrobacter sp.]|nr:glycoside hydrolase family 32 protein [Fibrobacter sp.]